MTSPITNDPSGGATPESVLAHIDNAETLIRGALCLLHTLSMALKALPTDRNSEALLTQAMLVDIEFDEVFAELAQATLAATQIAGRPA